MKKFWPWFIPIVILIGVNIYLFNQLLLENKDNSLSSAKNITPTTSPSPKQDKEITLLAVGDIGLGREINYQIKQKQNANYPFEKITPLIKKADWAIGNLEGPLIKNCTIKRTGFKFCGASENVAGLVYAGFDAINLANNHSRNYGIDGYQQTINTLAKNNINYFDSQTIDYQTIGQTKFAFLGFDDTVEKVKSEKLKLKSQEVKKNVDILIVNFHWGQEYKKEPNQRQVELAHFAIDNGADIIIGHHPHVIQPLEYYQDKPIFYSLGNFVFDQMWSKETKTGAIGLITIKDNKIIKTEIKKTFMTNCCQPELLK